MTDSSYDYAVDDDSPEFVQSALSRVAIWFGYYSRQIQQARAMRAFTYVSQWDNGTLSARVGKPSLEFNIILPIVRSLKGEQREANPQIEVYPTDLDIPQEVVNVREGLLRQIGIESRAKIVYETAFNDQLNCGYGAMLVDLEFESPDSFNQVIRLRAINDALNCAWDPADTHPNKITGDFCYRPLVISKEEFKRRWPDKNVASATIPSFSSFNAVQFDATEYDAFIGDYYCKKYYTKTIFLLDNGQSITKDDFEELSADLKKKRKMLKKMESFLPPALYSRLYEETEIPKIVDKKKSTDYKIMHYLITTSEVLEKTEFPSRYLPLVYVDGDSTTLDGVQWPIPFAKPAVDAQRLLNYAKSLIADGLLTSRKEQYMMTPAMYKGFERYWENPENVQGAMLHGDDPKRPGATPVPITAPPFNPAYQTVALQAENDIRSTTGRYADNAGQQSNAESGRAIEARQNNGNLTVGVYPDNLLVAMESAALIQNDLITNVYDNQRTVTIRAKNGETKVITINKKRPVPVIKDGEEVFEVENDMTIGKFGVGIKAGSSFAAQRAEELQQLNEFLQASQAPAFPIIGDKYAELLNVQNVNDIAKRVKDNIVPPAIIAQEENKPPPPPPPPTTQQKIEMASLAVSAKQAEAALAKADAEKTTAQADKIKAFASVVQQRSKTKATEFSALAEIENAVAETTATQVEVMGRIADTYMKTENTKLEKENEFYKEIFEDLTGA